MQPYLIARVDLDYVPWDTPDAQEFGHGEPANVLRMLELAHSMHTHFQFFASVRWVRAFPSFVDAIKEKGHPIDWLCKHPTVAARQREAIEAFESAGLETSGLATRGAWPESGGFEPDPRFKFLSAPAGHCPTGLSHFELNTKPDRESIRSGSSARAWSEKIRLVLRDCASRGTGATISVRPQVLGKFDPKLHVLSDLLHFASAIGMPLKTCQAILLEHRKI